MIKKFLKKIWNRFWRRQDKKLDELKKKVTALEKSLEEEKKLTRDLKSYVKKEMERRDEWEKRSAELRYLAKGKKIWVIKNPAPANDDKVNWGEYGFYLNMKKQLEDQGYYVFIDYHEDWNGPIDADYVLVSLAARKYRPDRRMSNCKYFLWMNCYVDRVDLEECELYDAVLVSSKLYAEKLAKEVSVPVIPFLLCAEADKFYPKEAELTHDKVFVGNTRGVKRDCIYWCEEHQIEVDLWGRKEGNMGWAKRMKEDSSVKLHGFLPNNELPDVFRASKIVLNDHFDDMKREGFINLRTIEALFCGCAILSDYHQELENLFGDTIVYYRDEEEFLEKLAWLEEHYEEQRQKVLATWPKIREEFSLENRVKTLIEISENI